MGTWSVKPASQVEFHHAPVTPPAASHHEELAGLVKRATHHNDESGFSVLRVKARGHRNIVTVVGTLPKVRVGEGLGQPGKSTCAT
jgi:exodeoxyribonuclease V alpha subunit